MLPGGRTRYLRAGQPRGPDAEDDIYLTFFYQGGGRGNAPTRTTAGRRVLRA